MYTVHEVIWQCPLELHVVPFAFAGRVLQLAQLGPHAVWELLQGPVIEPQQPVGQDCVLHWH
jgi:hypothetical protein